MSGPMVHASLGASSAYRWMACPGSIALSQNIPRKDSVYSLEGTAAHALSELAFKAKMNPSNWLGEKVEGVVVSQDMVLAVEVYVDFLHTLASYEGQLMLEHRFDLSKLMPPAPMFGTSDCVAYLAGERKLVVADYKHGAGVAVEVENNSQLMYYGLGALLQLDPKMPVEEVEMVIVQPRAPHKDGPIRRWKTTTAYLLDFSLELIEAAHATTKADAKISAGKHCRFCPAQPLCPELHRETQVVAQTEFTTKPLLDIRLLTPEQIGMVLERADVIEDWIRSIRQHVQTQLEQGTEVPGWKLVPKRAMRTWGSETEVVAWAKTKGLETDELYELKIKSPAALEKTVGKKNLPKELVVSISSGHTLAPASDPRPAVANAAADEFSATPSLN